MKIMITGGTGLIGKALCRSLIADGHDVTVLTRNPDKLSGQLPASLSGVQLKKWDSKTIEGWGQAVNETDAIINLAGEGIADGRWSPARKRLIRESRLQAGNAVAQAIKAATTKPKLLLQASAVGYYGVHGDEILTEASPNGNDFLAKICADWESCTASVKQFGVRRPILRTGVVLSKEGGAFPKQLLPFKFFIGGPIGSGAQWYPWIHIEDEVNAIKFLLQREQADGPYNLTAPNPVTNKAFGEALGRVMGRPAFAPAPSFVFKTLFGEMSTVLLDGQRVLPTRLQEAGFTFKYPTVEAAVGQLVKEKI